MSDERSNSLTTGQAAKLCSVTPDTMLKWIKKGRLSAVRTAGGHYRIERRHLEPLISGSRGVEGASRPLSECDPQRLRCWEYLSDGGVVREDCQQCVVYRVRAARCFMMAGLEADVGHARRFCQTSCDECVYYRRVKGLATHVLVITSDDDLLDRLAGEEDDSIAVRFARNGYEAATIIQDFRPAFAAIDVERIPVEDATLLDSLAADARVPGLKILLVVPSGMRDRKRRLPQSDAVVGVLEKPFDKRKMAEAINRLLVDSSGVENSRLLAMTGKEER